MRLLTLTLVITSGLTAAAPAQILVPSTANPYAATPATVVAQPAVTATPTATSSSTSSSGDDLKQQRLQKINALQFDRRPSTILTTWLEFSKEQKKKEQQPEKKDEPEAKAEPAEDKQEPDDEASAEKSDDEAKSDAKKSDNDAKDDDESKDDDKDSEGQEDKKDKDADDDKGSEKDSAEDPEAKAKAEAEKKKAEAEKAKAEAARKAAETAKALAEFDKQLKDFQRDVTLGRWAEVKTFLAGLEKEEAKAAYARLLDGLRSGQAQQQGLNPQLLQQMILDGADQATIQAVMSASGQGPGAAFREKNRFAMEDIAGLIAAAPHEHDNDTFTKLGTILRMAVSEGHDLEELLARLTAGDGAEPILTKRELARLLCASSQEARAGEYLPALDEAEAQSDAQALNLLARHYLALHGEEKKAKHLESAWHATQAVLALEPPADEPEPEEKPKEEPAAEAPADAEKAEAEKKPKEPTAEEKAEAEAKKKREELRDEIKAALTRAVELAPRLKEELGQAWLDQSFTARIDRGREILVALGKQVALALPSRPRDADFRLKSLELQRTAVEALLRAAPETAADWQDALTLLASNWLNEAEATYRLDNRNRYGPQWQRDRYGNYYYVDDESDTSRFRYQNGNTAEPIATGDLLDARPHDNWLKLVDKDLQPKFAITFSQLYLKAQEDAEAFPYIEQLAATHPAKAHDLAEEFLRVWTSNHNPNDNTQNRSPYIYYYGYEQRADRIPLTRSKQERNLKELGQWLARLRALPIDDLDEELLARAFTTSHSTAEVYRLEALESVFGSIDSLQPRTLAELIQQMRGNLAGVWRLPAVQTQNSTNRKQKDIEAEVRRGYELAKNVVQHALEKHPDDWSLVMAEAALLHDENDFFKELKDDSKFSERRREALSRYQRAAELYAAAVDDMTEEEQTTKVYEQWLYAGLGAVDLERVTAEKVADDKQPPLIREAIMSLPGEAAERHISQFANNLFTRLRSAKPELKYRYLKSGFEIVGDHKMAREAHKLLEYYADLVSEIKLEAKIDGPDTVGQEPFGVFVNILHTKEIERESGGFGRYLQNQNSNQYYYYNFGRPTQNYRDKFRDTVVQGLDEQFEVVSVTFQEPEVNSKSGAEYGWRVTPYAYLLLKARGPEIDKIAPLRLDLDFLDTSGYAMLPVETPAVPVDAGSEKPPARPADEISLVQTLDERQADEGKLILEIRAKGRGLMPRLDELVTFDIPGFAKEEVEGGDLSVTQFDKEGDETAVLSERVWLVTMRAAEGAEPAKTFHFAEAKMPLKESIFQRYEDADLVTVEPEISLEARYADPGNRWLLWLSAAGAVVLAVGGLVAFSRARGRQQVEAPRFQMPDSVTPLTVLGLLRDIQTNNGLSDSDKHQLGDSIDRLERHYFAAAEEQEPNLEQIAAAWVAKTSGRN